MDMPVTAGGDRLEVIERSMGICAAPANAPRTTR